MKTAITFLFVLLSMFIPIKADEYSTGGTYTVDLVCNRLPSYSVKIPRTLSVENTTTQLNFEVKGDLFNTQKLKVLFDSSTYLNYGSKQVPVTITQSKTSWSNTELSNEYLTSTAIISHGPLSAGNWTGTLNVTIQLSEV